MGAVIRIAVIVALLSVFWFLRNEPVDSMALTWAFFALGT